MIGTSSIAEDDQADDEFLEVRLPKNIKFDLSYEPIIK